MFMFLSKGKIKMNIVYVRMIWIKKKDGWFFKTNLDAFMHFNNQQYL